MQDPIGLRGKKLWSHVPIMFFIRCCSSQLWKKNSLPNDAFSVVNRRCWPGKQGPGNRRVNVNLDSPSQAFALSKSGQKIICQKEYKCANIFKRLKVKFSFCKIQENRGVAVNLGFASASVPRKKSPAASFVSQKFQHSMLQKYLLAFFMSLKIRSQNFMNWCYKIFSFHFYFPKNPHSTPGSWKIGFTMEFQIRPGALVPSLWGMLNRHATRKLRCRQQYEPPKSYIFICFN